MSKKDRIPLPKQLGFARRTLELLAYEIALIKAESSIQKAVALLGDTIQNCRCILQYLWTEALENLSLEKYILFDIPRNKFQEGQQVLARNKRDRPKLGSKPWQHTIR